MLKFLLKCLTRCFVGSTFYYDDKVIECLKDKGKGLVIFSNHPSYIDPIILFLEMSKYRNIVPVIGENIFVEYPALFRNINVVVAPNFERGTGEFKEDLLDEALAKSRNILKKNGALLVYPTGRLQRKKDEKLKNEFFAFKLLEGNSDKINCISARVDGGWDTAFSFKGSRERGLFKRAILSILGKFGFGKYADSISISLEVIKGIFKKKDLDIFNETLNKYLHCIPSETLSKSSVLSMKNKEYFSLIKSAVKNTGFSKKINLETDLDIDLGMDSLDRAIALANINKTSGKYLYSVNTKVSDIIKDFEDVDGVAKKKIDDYLDRLSDLKKEDIHTDVEHISSMKSLLECFLYLHKTRPNLCIIADEKKNYTVSEIFTAADSIAKISKITQSKSKYVGIMLPCAGACIISAVAIWISEKVPVFFGTSVSGIDEIIDKLEITTILSSYDFVDIAVKKIGPSSYKKLVFLDKLDLSRYAYAVQSEVFANFDNIKVDKIAAILLTSGVSGKPKCVPTSNASAIDNMQGVFDRILSSITLDRPVFNCLPAFHAFGLFSASLMPIIGGVPVVMVSNPFNVQAIIRILKKSKPSVIFSIPSIIIKWVGFLKDNNEFMNFKTLIALGAESISSKEVNEIKKYFPKATIFFGYGLTECAPVIAFDEFEKEGVVGRPLKGFDIFLKNKDLDGFGEICVHGPSVFSGYLFGKKQKKPYDIDQKQAFNTMDLGRLLDNGSIELSGRLDRVIKIGGEKVSLDCLGNKLRASLNPNGSVVILYCSNSSKKSKLDAFKLVVVTDKKFSLVQANGVMQKHSKARIYSIEVLKVLPMLGSGKINIKELMIDLKNKFKIKW
ncbi:MAG: AMP-binding protein [Chlamydiia bacterium]|nr:AMP-binding protein [Chlamydiia bacterium]